MNLEQLPTTSPQHAQDPRVRPRQLVELPDDCSIALVQTGQGRDCLLIHGTLVTLEDMWISLAPMLARDFRVTAVDRPGHGLSRRRRFVDASPWRQAELIHDAGRRAGLHRPIVVGHSYGGTVALAYAMRYPTETAGVVALAPMCFPEVRVEAMLLGPRSWPGIGEMLARTAAVSGDSLLLPLLWHAMYLPQVMPRAVAEGFPFPLAGRPSQMIAEAEDALALPAAVAAMACGYASCRVPVRIIGGACDAVVNNAAQGAVAAAWLAAGRFSCVPGAGHMLHHFEQGMILEACSGLTCVSTGSTSNCRLTQI